MNEVKEVMGVVGFVAAAVALVGLAAAGVVIGSLYDESGWWLFYVAVVVVFGCLVRMWRAASRGLTVQEYERERQRLEQRWQTYRQQHAAAADPVDAWHEDNQRRFFADVGQLLDSPYRHDRAGGGR